MLWLQYISKFQIKNDVILGIDCKKIKIVLIPFRHTIWLKLLLALFRFGEPLGGVISPTAPLTNSHGARPLAGGVFKSLSLCESCLTSVFITSTRTNNLNKYKTHTAPVPKYIPDSMSIMTGPALLMLRTQMYAAVTATSSPHEYLSQ